MKLISPASVGMCATRLSRINTLMQAQVDQGELVGVSTLVARRGKVVHFQQFGCRDRENHLPMQADTLFRFYSMTKPIVCTAFMLLYEQGKFDLADPVARYIPAFANLTVLEKQADGQERQVPLKRPVTLQHLLTHTSGLVYDFYEEHSVSKQYQQHQILSKVKGVSLAGLVDKLCTIPLAFQPGERWFYSIAIDVVARLIEIIFGATLSRILATESFLRHLV